MNNLIQNLVQPLLSRVGTIAATWLVANGFDTQHAVTVETAITAIGLFAVDFGVRLLSSVGRALRWGFSHRRSSFAHRLTVLEA